MKHICSLVFGLLWFWPGAMSAQTEIDEQIRLVIHPTKDLKTNKYITGWAVGNLRSNTPDSVNLFGGIGLRGDTWSLESMVWRQFRQKNQRERQQGRPGTDWALDFRFQKKLGQRIALYVEGAPFLTRKAWYEFVVVDYLVWKRMSLGFETENTHQAGPDYIRAGLRAGLPIWQCGGNRASFAVAYRVGRSKGQNELRAYFVTHLRF